MNIRVFKLLKLNLIPIIEVLGKVVVFLNAILIVRVLNMNDFGIYSYIISIAAWASILMDLGISNLTYNDFLSNKTEFVNVNFTNRFLFAFITSIFLAVFFYRKGDLFFIPGLFLTLTIVFNSSTNLLKLAMRGMQVKKIDGIIIILEPFIRLIFLIVAFILLSKNFISLVNFSIIYFLISSTSFAIALILVKKHFTFKLTFESIHNFLKNLKKTFSKTKYYFIYVFTLFGIMRLDFLYIEAIFNAESLSIYSSAFNIYNMLLLFMTALITSRFREILSSEKKYLISIFLFLLVAVLSIFILTDVIYKVIYPSQYLQGAYYLKIMIITIIPATFSKYLFIKNNYNKLTRINVIAVLFPFAIKFITYQIMKFNELEKYVIVFIITEAILFIILLIMSNNYKKRASQHEFI